MLLRGVAEHLVCAFPASSQGRRLLHLFPILIGITGETCHIRISDNGIGFEEQYKDRIFEVFQRLHSKSDYEGTGIGLSIVKKIVENHKGTIKATSHPGQGATFDILIPANRP